ncbi:hypothetical protein GQ457_03G038330 [Hibiscus cannabinus]
MHSSDALPMTPGTNEAADSRQGKRTKEAKKAAGQDTRGGGDDINKHIKLQSLIEKSGVKEYRRKDNEGCGNGKRLQGAHRA